MNEIQKLLADNLVEALRQIQGYLVLALGGSLSAFALAFRPSQVVEERIGVPGVSIPLTRSGAHMVLWILTVMGGFVAGSSAHRAVVIAHKLTSVPGLLGALGTFPAIATSHPFWG